MIAGIGGSGDATLGGDCRRTGRPRFGAGRVRPERAAPSDVGARAASGAPRTTRPPLDDMPKPEAPLPAAARAAAAARAFSAGNGYVTGLLIDRII